MKRQARLNNKEVLQYINIIKQFNFVLLISAIIVLPTQVLWSQETKKPEKADSTPTIQEMVSMINTDVDPEYIYTYEKRSVHARSMHHNHFVRWRNRSHGRWISHHLGGALAGK